MTTLAPSEPAAPGARPPSSSSDPVSNVYSPASAWRGMRAHGSARLVSAVLLAALAALAAVALLGLAMKPAPAYAAGTVRYAAPTAQGSGNCSSWANACTLAYALSVAQSGDQIWVKAGVHTPGPQPQ